MSALARLGEGALQTVRSEAEARPARWRDPLRRSASSQGPTAAIAADLLSTIGSSDDAALLRSLAAREKGLRPFASAITRRLAPHVYISDLGIVELRVDEVALNRRLRRKVLGLLCFVSSRPSMASTRDEALEALWPDLAPGTAVNSLHQTIYFLRRLLEPDYREGVGAGYVQFDGEVLSLDADLLDSGSRLAWRLIGSWQRGDQGSIDQLLATYKGKFALDFSYEEWATAYRENLHAAVLGAVEEEVATLIQGGDADAAILHAQRILLVDPTADAIELQLLRAYKRGGRHAAAAEQYAHYSSMLRDDLGAEPPSLGDI